MPFWTPVYMLCGPDGKKNIIKNITPPLDAAVSRGNISGPSARQRSSGTDPAQPRTHPGEPNEMDSKQDSPPPPPVRQ